MSQEQVLRNLLARLPEGHVLIAQIRKTLDEMKK
jgi:hypothetical protein